MDRAKLQQVVSQIPSLATLKTWAFGDTSIASDATASAAATASMSPTKEEEEIAEEGHLGAAKPHKRLLRQKLDEIDDLIYPLLRWLLISNPSHLRLLRPFGYEKHCV